ncbi:hypothetical protein DFO55_105153 [Grimontella sp. AG753]|jgi:hypothetical protein|nr:hypothetical protein DFO55_105153 [Grimontella sp. AG753]
MRSHHILTLFTPQSAAWQNEKSLRICGAQAKDRHTAFSFKNAVGDRLFAHY